MARVRCSMGPAPGVHRQDLAVKIVCGWNCGEAADDRINQCHALSVNCVSELCGVWTHFLEDSDPDHCGLNDKIDATAQCHLLNSRLVITRVITRPAEIKGKR